MPTPQEQSQIFNEAIAQGLSEADAIAAAGITETDAFYIDTSGQLTPFSSVVDRSPASVPAQEAVDYGSLSTASTFTPNTTAAEWGQTVENLDLLKKSSLTQLNGINANINELTNQRQVLSEQYARAFASGDVELASILEGRINNVNEKIKGSNLAAANVAKDIAQFDQDINYAFRQQTLAESATPLLNATTPPIDAPSDQLFAEEAALFDQDTTIADSQDPFSDPFFADNSNDRIFTEDADTAFSNDDDPLVDQQPEQVENTAWFDQDVTTSQETVTGGSVRTTTVTPTISLDTPESQFYQAAADDVAAQKAARAAELRAQGLSGAAILQDSQYRSLSQRQQELEYQSWQSKETVGGTPTVTIEPGSGEEFEQTVDINRLDSLTNDDPDAELAEISAQPDLINETNFNVEAAPVGGNYTEVYNPETGNYDVVDLDNGDIVAEGLSQQEAMIQAQDLSFGDPAYPQPQEELITEREINFGPDNGPLEEDDLATAALEDTIIRGNETDVRADVNTQDWRVRLSLAPGANYLYADPDLALGSIMSPLKNTNGVIFPYTPQIDITYQANYSSDALTHSNYYSYFYQSSYVQTVQVRGTFTAQDTQDANYLLAVIHFLRSATKMFYGQDTEAGTPPPLVFLSGLGSFQFNNHPCVISQFNYNLPSDVDYIPAGTTVANYEGGSNYGFANIGQVSSGAGLLAGIANSLGGPLSRLLTLGADAIGNQVQRGADPVSRFTANTSQVADPTYVPTKMEISLVLLPVISRTRVSSVFSLKDYASGSLIKKGFW